MMLIHLILDPYFHFRSADLTANDHRLNGSLVDLVGRCWTRCLMSEAIREMSYGLSPSPAFLSSVGDKVCSCKDSC